jgi:hypothetical protein
LSRARALLAEAQAYGVRVVVDGPDLVVRGPKDALAPFIPMMKTHKAELLAVLSSATATAGAQQDKTFCFTLTQDPLDHQEALEERAAIIAECPGMDPRQALQEALWQAEREQCWRRFLRHASKIMEAPPGQRPHLLDLYHRDAAAAFGKATGSSMATTMRQWIAARTERGGHDNEDAHQ